jgi:ATP-binding protein involved in chromosome partitioning
MAISKQEIQKALEQIGVSEIVHTIQVIENQVCIDIISDAAALHERKRLEKGIEEALKEQINDNNLSYKITVQHQTNKEEKEITHPIKGEKIEGVQNIIAIASGKGGVGKSTITSNLAITLSEMGFKVGILDADIYGPSAPTMFAVEGKKPKSIHIDGKQRIEPIERLGIKIMSIGFFTELNQAVAWRGPMASKALNQMIRDTYWGKLDFLLVDLPPGTGDIHLSLVQQIPITGAIIVSTPQKVALADVRKGVEMFKMPQINVPILGLIENMAYFIPEELPNNKYYIFGKEGAKNMAEEIGIPFLGQIPLIQSIREGGDNGTPIVTQKKSLTCEIYKQITQNAVENLVKRNTELPPSEAVKITTMAGCSSK